MIPLLTHEIRPDERRGAAGAFLVLFGILTAHTLLETARDALFLARLPASQLPWVYLAMAGVAVALAELPWKAPRRLTAADTLALLLLACAAVTFGFWLLGTWHSPWTLRALYVWTGLLGTLAALQFWLVMSELYTITQAKRVYRFIATGSLLGAVAGAGFARVLSAQGPPQQLVLASALVLAATSFGPLLLRGSDAPAAAPLRRGVLDTVQMLRTNPYVSRLAGLVLISTVALTLADYVFKSTVARNVPSEELAGFFATVYVFLNAAALAVQLLLMGWLFRVVGLHRALWVLPVLVFVGASGLALGGGLVAALILKGADGSLRHSLHRTSTELLFVPIPDGVRHRAKPLIDVVGQRGGQALASVLILAEVSLHRGDAVLAAGAAALCIVWVAWAADLKPHYLELFRAALREGSMRRNAESPDLDLGSLEALFSALNSRDDAEVVGALELLAEEDRVRLVPALILYHPSPMVVLRSLELFSAGGRSDFVPIAERLDGHPDPEVRAAALRARSTVKSDEAALRAASQDGSPLVRATALVGLVGGGWIADEAQTLLDGLRAANSPEGQRALARAIAHQPGPVFEDLLLELAESRDGDVLSSVARAMGTLKSPRFFDALLDMLVHHDARDAARAALLTYGSEALARVDRALGDPDLPQEIRRHLPRTISRFPAADAAPVLLKHLVTEGDGLVRFKILRGLGRIASQHPEVAMDRRILRQAVDRTLEAAFRLLHWRLTLRSGVAEVPARATPGNELLSALLLDKEVHAVERVFRLLGLLYRGEDFETLYRGLQHSNPKVRASSREILEHTLRAPLRNAVMTLVDDAPDAVRLVGASAFYAATPLGYQELLVTLLEQNGETLRCLAAYHVGELGLDSLRGRLEAFRSQETGFFVTRVIERALGLLAQRGQRRLLLAE